MRKLVLAVAATLTAAAFTLAYQTPIAQAKEGYGMAGCGLGSILFGNEPGFVQIFAATTNASSGNQTFAITTGTSNCEDTGGGTESAKAFIETNRETLAKDISRGGGETISSLTTLAGCSDAAAVGSTLQGEFQNIFPSADVSDTQVSSSVIETLKSHQELGCQLS